MATPVTGVDALYRDKQVLASKNEYLSRDVVYSALVDPGK
jgi:hypothetical protein